MSEPLGVVFTPTTVAHENNHGHTQVRHEIREVLHKTPEPEAGKVSVSELDTVRWA